METVQVVSIIDIKNPIDCIKRYKNELNVIYGDSRIYMLLIAR